MLLHGHFLKANPREFFQLHFVKFSILARFRIRVPRSPNKIFFFWIRPSRLRRQTEMKLEAFPLDTALSSLYTDLKPQHTIVHIILDCG